VSEVTSFRYETYAIKGTGVREIDAQAQSVVLRADTVGVRVTYPSGSTVLIPWGRIWEVWYS
jgi:hypothetical protein